MLMPWLVHCVHLYFDKMDLYFDRLYPPKEEEEDDERESVQIWREEKKEKAKKERRRMRKRKESLQENRVAVCVKDSGLWVGVK